MVREEGIHAYLLKQFPRQFENFHTFENDREHVIWYYSTDELVESVNFDTISDSNITLWKSSFDPQGATFKIDFDPPKLITLIRTLPFFLCALSALKCAQFFPKLVLSKSL